MAKKKNGTTSETLETPESRREQTVFVCDKCGNSTVIPAERRAQSAVFCQTCRVHYPTRHFVTDAPGQPHYDESA